MSDPINMLIADFNTMLTTAATSKQVSEAEERIQDLIIQNQKIFITLVMQILSDDIDDGIAIQCFIYLKKIFTPTREISRDIIFSTFYTEYGDIQEDLDSMYSQYILSDKLPIRVNVAASFSQYINSTIDKNNLLPIYQQLLSTVKAANNPNYDDGLLRLTYESDQINIFKKDRFGGYLGGVLEIAEKWITYTACNDEFDSELFKSALHCYDILLPLIVETMLHDDFSHLRFYFEIAPEILPKCDIYSYDLVFNTFYDICTLFYSISDNFFSEVYPIAMMGLETEGEFLETTLCFWKKLAKFEFDQVRKYFSETLPNEWRPIILNTKDPSIKIVEYGPKDLILNSLGTLETIDGYLLNVLLSLLRPPDDFPTDYIAANPELTIQLTAARVIVESIPLFPELIVRFIIPFINEKISTDCWQDVYSALLAIQAIMYKFSYAKLHEYATLYMNLLIDILALDIPILVGTAAVVLINIMNQYKNRVTLEQVGKIQDSFQNPVVHSGHDIFMEYTSLLRIAYRCRVKVHESEPLIEFLNNVILPMRASDHEKIQHLDSLLVDIYPCLPQEAAIHVFEEVEAVKMENETIPSSSFYVLALYARYVYNDFPKQSLDMCKKTLEDFVAFTETEFNEMEVVDVCRFLGIIFNFEEFYDVVKPFGEPLMYFFQKCFQTDNPVDINFSVRLLGMLIYILKEANDQVNEAIEAIIIHLRESTEEVLVMYEANMVEALGTIVDGLRENILSEHLDAIYEILQSIYLKEVPDRHISSEERDYLIQMNTALFRALTGFIRGVGEDAKRPDFVKEMKNLLIRYIRKNVRDPELYDKNTLLAFYNFDIQLLETIGNMINIQACGRSVIDMIKIGTAHDDVIVQNAAHNLFKITRR